jgi:hypothetical protein
MLADNKIKSRLHTLSAGTGGLRKAADGFGENDNRL